MATRDMNVKVNILGDYDRLTRATRGAKHELNNFEKASKIMSRNVSKVFAGVGAALAIRSIARFSIEAAKAASEDRRSQALLAESLKRAGKAKQSDIDATEAMISRMEMATGVADDELRPAMSKLVSVTKNTKKAQDLLKLALGASAKSGKPVEATALAIAKAYTGQTMSLTRMFPELKNSTDLFGDLAAATKGLAAQNADPFEKLNRFIDNLKEKIGGPILAKLVAFGDSFTQQDWDTVNTAVDGIATGMQTFFETVGGGDQKLGVLRTVQTLALGIQAAFESAAGFLKIITGQKLDVTNMPVLKAAYDAYYNKDPKTGQYTTLKVLDPSGTAFRGNPNVGRVEAIRNTYNITVKGADNKVSAEATIAAIKSYERRTGRTYLNK